MPVYRYKAIDKLGRNLTGIMPAHDEGNLDEKLRNLGLWLADASQERVSATAEGRGQGSAFKWFKGSPSKYRRDLIDFCTLMTFQVRVGVPLSKSLETAAADCKNENFKNVLKQVQADLETGLQFFEALGKHPHIFDVHFVSVVRAGEISSKLPETFDDLKDYLEWLERIMNDVKQATIYPAIVLFVICCFTIFLFSYIIPQFSDLLGKMKVPQPFLTKVIFGIGDFTQATWFIWLPSILALMIAIPLAKRFSPKFLFAWDQMKLNLPVFGELNSMLALSKFAHNLSILYRSGIAIINALEMCQSGLIGNKVVEKAVKQVEEDVKTGSTISEALHRQSVFSAMLLRMAAMGESTGNLDKALDTVAEYYNDVIPRKIKKIFAILEPVLMLFLIFIVGCVALAIYLPILSLMSVVGKQ